MIPLTLFRGPDRPCGKRTTRARDALGAWFANPTITHDKASAGGFSLATFRDDRRAKANVEGVHAIALDIDKTEITPAAGAEIFKTLAGWVYTTARHAPAAPRWRAILLVSEPLSAVDYEPAWRHVARHVAGANHVAVDEAAKDASRFWFSPTVPPERVSDHECHELAGDLLDVPRLLEIARRTLPAAPRRPPATNHHHSDAYIRGALNRAARTIASATNGERNATLNREAFALARLQIDPTTLAGVLRDAARAAGLGATETQKTIASALRARSRGAT